MNRVKLNYEQSDEHNQTKQGYGGQREAVLLIQVPCQLLGSPPLNAVFLMLMECFGNQCARSDATDGNVNQQ